MCKQLFCHTCGKKVDYVMRCRVGDHVVHGVEIHVTYFIIFIKLILFFNLNLF